MFAMYVVHSGDDEAPEMVRNSGGVWASSEDTDCIATGAWLLGLAMEQRRAVHAASRLAADKSEHARRFLTENPLTSTHCGNVRYVCIFESFADALRSLRAGEVILQYECHGDDAMQPRAVAVRFATPATQGANNARD